MKEKTIGMLIVLTAVATLIGGVLATVYRTAAPKIEANRLAEEKRAIFEVLPEATKYETIEATMEGDKGEELVKIFKGFDDDGRFVGYAFTSAGPGFQAIIKMMVGLQPDYLKLSGMQVLEQLETPGLGNKILYDDFRDMFKGLELEPKIEYVKNKKPEKPNEIQAIAGATITSRAVVKIINEDSKRVIDYLKEHEGQTVSSE
ncbi:MAG: RnfABCDGE type electron transport complex subunit G [Thermodesulfobacteriota bacterium]